jgi:hypothetical protein
LWEEIWQRDSWLEILGRYLVPVRDDKKRLKGWIFPRYHQLDATRRLLAAVLADGPGGKYLIEHSAGSGKTNSIAWTAHFLADLHNAAHQKLFDTVLVVSDRTVLDTQLREAIQGFERTQGVVEVITGDGAAKSAQLAAPRLEKGQQRFQIFQTAQTKARVRSAPRMGPRGGSFLMPIGQRDDIGQALRAAQAAVRQVCGKTNVVKSHGSTLSAVLLAARQHPLGAGGNLRLTALKPCNIRGLNVHHHSHSARAA